MDIDKEVLKGHIDTIILSLLFDQDMYGYELAKKVLKISKDEFELKEGTMYLALKRLETHGYVHSYWGDSDNGGGRRKYYNILAAGKNKYKQKQQEWAYVKGVIDAFLMRQVKEETE